MALTVIPVFVEFEGLGFGEEDEAGFAGGVGRAGGESDLARAYWTL